MEAQAAFQDLLTRAPCDSAGSDGGISSGHTPVLSTNALLGTASAWAVSAGVTSLKRVYDLLSKASVEGWSRYFRKAPTLVDSSPAGEE
jgi:hypothetical protein